MRGVCTHPRLHCDQGVLLPRSSSSSSVERPTYFVDGSVATGEVAEILVIFVVYLVSVGRGMGAGVEGGGGQIVQGMGWGGGGCG